MDIKNQIQLINTQIMNIKLEIDKIDMQTNNLFMINYNLISEQLLNISIQMLNTGIQTFNIGKNISMNYNIYFEKLKLISEQINSIINENNIIQQQQMMQQQWMMMQNNLPMNIQPLNIQQSKPDIYYIIFSIPERNRITIHAQNEMTVQELINKFINKIKDEYSADIINKMKFYSPNPDIRILDRNDNKKKINSNIRNTTIYVEF